MEYFFQFPMLDIHFKSFCLYNYIHQLNMFICNTEDITTVNLNWIVEILATQKVKDQLQIMHY